MGPTDVNITHFGQFRWFGSLIVSTTIPELLNMVSVTAPEVLDIGIKFKVDFDEVWLIFVTKITHLAYIFTGRWNYWNWIWSREDI